MTDLLLEALGEITGSASRLDLFARAGEHDTCGLHGERVVAAPDERPRVWRAVAHGGQRLLAKPAEKFHGGVRRPDRIATLVDPPVDAKSHVARRGRARCRR